MEKLLNWIWVDNSEEKRHVEFLQKFIIEEDCCASLIVASDKQYQAFVNGHFVANGQFADALGNKSAFEIDISKYLIKGENVLEITACHFDCDFALCRVIDAGVAFEISNKEKVICSSSDLTLCRVSPNYFFNDSVTPQLGYGYKYSFNGNGEWNRAIIKREIKISDCKIKQCIISEPLETEVISQGVFKYNGGETDAELCQNAWLSTLRFLDMTGLERTANCRLNKSIKFSSSIGDGLFIMVDLLKEVEGYLTFVINTIENCDAIIVWGEHLNDLRIRSAVGERNFATRFKLKKGENIFKDYLYRLGGRYLCLFIESQSVEIRQLSVMPSTYPFNFVKRNIDDRFLSKIYEVSARTLQICAHEHYEDCPWREQAFYAMDARNHALYGYSAFKEYEFPRVMFKLIAQSMREDGLPELCSPAIAPITIPSFGLYWILAVKENADVDYNRDFVEEMIPFAEKMIGAFEKRTSEIGVSAFTEPCYWNFHEWTEGLDGGLIFRDKDIEPYGDGMLTALVIIASDSLAQLEKSVGNIERYNYYTDYAKKLGETLENYYDSQSGLYFSSIRNGQKQWLHCCTQAAFLMTGKVPFERTKKMCQELKHPSVALPLTVGELQFKYESILRYENDVQYCIDDVCNIFGKMLFNGATSFWETEKGEADFYDAGSLCHAWSSVACWLFDRVGIAKEIK